METSNGFLKDEIYGERLLISIHADQTRREIESIINELKP